MRVQFRLWHAGLVATVAVAVWIWPILSPPPRLLRVGAWNRPPLLLETPEGTPTGVAVAVLDEAARRLGYQLQWSLHREGPERAIEEDGVDLWPVLNAEAVRGRNVYVSQPWMVSELVLFTLKSSKLTSVAQMAGKRIATLDRPAIKQAINARLADFTVVYTATFDKAMEAVCTGTADAAFVDSRSAQAMLLDRPASCVGEGLQSAQMPPALLPLGIASSRRYAQTAELLSNEILRMGADGTLPRIVSVWSLAGTHDTEALHAIRKAEEKTRYLACVVAILVLLLGVLALVARRLNSSRQVAGRALQVKATLLTNVGHEIRTPMNGIVGMTNLLFTTELSEEQKEYAEAAQSSAESLLEMLTNMLDYARMDQGRLVFENVDFDLHGLLDDVVEHYGPIAARKGLEIACLIGQETPQIVTGDPVRLRQVLNNLVSNAVKFTNQGEVVLSTRVVSEESSQVVLHIEVSDTGIGIKEEDRPKLFKIFGQMDNPGEEAHSGTGLGLAICKQIVTGAGGYMDYHSIPGAGSVFWAVLRFGRAKFDLPAPEQDPALASLRVLIAIDSLPVRKMIRNHCRALGMKFTESPAGPAALDTLRSGRYQLVIGDYDGSEMKTIAESKSENTKLILLTSPAISSMEPSWQDGESGRFINAMIQKPMRQNSLFYAIREAISPAAEGDDYALSASARDGLTRS